MAVAVPSTSNRILVSASSPAPTAQQLYMIKLQYAPNWPVRCVFNFILARGRSGGSSVASARALQTDQLTPALNTTSSFERLCVCVHETVVAWVRKWFRKRPFKAVEDVDVNCKRFLERSQECEDHINRNHNVDGLCRKVVRLNDPCERKGGRLPH